MFNKIGGGIGLIAGWIWGLVFRQSAQLKIKNLKGGTNQEQFYKIVDMWKMIYMGIDGVWNDFTQFTMSAMSRVVSHGKKINVAAVAVKKMSSLINTQKNEIVIDDWIEGQKLWDEYSKKINWNRLIQRKTSRWLAMGGIAIKFFVAPGAEHTLDDIKMDIIDADQIVATRWDSVGNVIDAAFITYEKKDKWYYTRIEYHELNEDGKRQIRFELYKAEQKSATTGAKCALSELYPGQEEIVVLERMEKTFVYMATPFDNNIDLTSPLGISIYANSMDSIKTLNTIMEVFYNEFATGKKRLMVPERFMKKVLDTSSGEFANYFDMQDPLYQAYKANPQSSEDNLKEISFELRVDEITKAINIALDIFSMECGFSSGSFSFDGKSMKTATEVISEDSETFKTKVNIESALSDGFEQIIHMFFEVCSLYDIIGEIPEYEFSAKFDDSIIVDDEKVGEVAMSEVEKGLRSKMSYLIAIRKMSEQEAKEELALIEQDAQMMFDDSTDDAEEQDYIDKHMADNPDDDEEMARESYKAQLKG